VSVELLTAKTRFREFEQQRDKGLQSGSNIDKEIEPNTARSSSSELEMLDDREMNKSKVSASQRTPTEKLHKDVAIVFEKNHRLRGSLEASESSITELKMELSLLQIHANEMGNETKKFSQELASEIALGQGLSKKVTFLKSEFSKLKTDLQKLTEMKSSSQFMERNIKKSDHVKKVKWVDGVLLVEDQIRNLKEKVCVGSHEPDLSFFEVLFNTVQDLKKEIVEPESMLPFGELPSPPLGKILVAMGLLRISETYLIILLVLLPCTLNLLARLPLNDKYSKQSFQWMDFKGASSVPAFVYDEKSFDNGPAPPPPPFTPPPPGKSHNNRSRSPPSGTHKGSDAPLSNETVERSWGSVLF
ncbi:hypothetical protein Tco_1451553, partial [Tanacetum coccineum]